MRAFAGPRAFQPDWELSLSAYLNKCACILFPIGPIEVHRQKKAGLIQKHRINPEDEVFASTISSGKMPANAFVRYGKETLVRTIRALNPWLFADAAHPFVSADGRIPALTGLSVLESARVNVFSPPEEGSKQRDFLIRRRMIRQRPS
jgi:hypothetical protein